jgi:hypothetical protein
MNSENTGDRRHRGLDTPARRGPASASGAGDGYITEQDIRRAVARWEELAPLDDDDPPPTAKI